jgi:hypothetical protein
MPAEVVAVKPGDYEELAAFLAAFPGDKSNAEAWLLRLRAWWDENPAFSEEVARGWALRDSGRIVGFFGSIPLQFQIGGKATTAFAGTTWRVLPPYRGISMALKTRQMDEQRGTLHFSTTPAPKVAGMLKLLRYQPISNWQGGDQQSLVVFDFGKLLRRRFKDTLPGRLAAMAATPCAAFLQWISLRKLRTARALTRTRTCAPPQSCTGIASDRPGSEKSCSAASLAGAFSAT